MYGMCICAMANMVNECVCGMCVWQMGIYVGNVGCVVYGVCVCKTCLYVMYIWGVCICGVLGYGMCVYVVYIYI